MALAPWHWVVLALVVVPPLLWLLWRGLIVAMSSRCPRCHRRYYSRPLHGDRRYERWHCARCNYEWDERYQ